MQRHQAHRAGLDQIGVQKAELARWRENTRSSRALELFMERGQQDREGTATGVDLCPGPGEGDEHDARIHTNSVGDWKESQSSAVAHRFPNSGCPGCSWRVCQRAAQTPFICADSDAKLRRAMNQNYRQIKDTQEFLVAIEQGNKNATLAHGTSSLRCATKRSSEREAQDVFHPELPEQDDVDIEELDAECEPEEPGEADARPEVQENMLPGIVVPLLCSHVRRVSGSERMSSTVAMR